MRIIKLIFLAGVFYSCNSNTDYADLVILNSIIYTVDENSRVVESLAVKDGMISQIGSSSELESLIGDSTKVLNLNGGFVYPGFIEGHAHLMDIGSNLINVDLSDAESYEEVIEMVKQRALQTPEGGWIVGRGWHQDKWVNKKIERQLNGFPTHEKLSQAIPNHPVYLSHASGHAGLANQRAMELAQVDAGTSDPSGGEIMKDVTGQPTGIFNETATLILRNKIPKDTKELLIQKLKLGIEECLKNGITGFHDARSDAEMIEVLEEIAGEDDLKLRMHLMLDGLDTALVSRYLQIGPQHGLYNDHINIRAVKLYADGALGSRGAWLLDEYSDAKGVHGHIFTPLSKIDDMVKRATQKGFQVCTHAIGDRANREVLNIYETNLKKYPELAEDHRYRIEHAQHIDPEDIPRFAQLGVLPAMQAIHMSSDRPWAIDRLGKKRIENGAYMWRELIENGSVIINGTDAPVEPVNPFASFYASVSRKTLEGKPSGGYEPSQKMSREEALKSYTIWAAYGAFMENKVGSIELGKLADFTILDKDIMTVAEDEILNVKVRMTIIDGDVVYSND